MLMNLQVRDFAIVEKIDIEFDPGMTVLTGETGAGKSILVDALGLVLGERGSAQLVREGANVRTSQQNSIYPNLSMLKRGSTTMRLILMVNASCGASSMLMVGLARS